MMKVNINILILGLILWTALPLHAQEILSKSSAIEIALENNFGVNIARNTVKIAENNKDILNSGYLPSVTGNAGASANIDNTDTEFSNGSTTSLSNAESSRYNASINLNYTLFDGLGRLYDYRRLKEQYQLTELQARETIENTIIQLFSVYYNLAQLSENVSALEQSLQISKERLVRAEYQFDYGQNTKLGVLNAQVDINNDSISVINIRQQLVNSKRDLNFVLGRDSNLEFIVDTIVTFSLQLNKADLFEKMKQNNVSLLQIDKNIAISQYDVKGIKSAYLPTVGLTGSYGWNKNNNNAAAFAKGSTNVGLSAGLNLSWSLFDGGNTLTRVKNAKINLDTQELLKDQMLLDINRDFNNAWDDYQNKFQIFQIQEQNIVTNKNNFERTQEKFKLGQATSIEFRQAQLNLLNAELSRNRAKYDAKLAELFVLQLSGELLNVDF